MGGISLSITRVRRTVARVLVLALAAAGLTIISGVSPAAASGCSVPPCGALTNHTKSRIGVKWTDNDGKTWKYAVVAPNTTKGGYWNDGIDVDFWYIPAGCTDKGGIGGTSYTWKGEKWAKISSTQTVVIKSRSC
jgi:hypothetical protein